MDRAKNLRSDPSGLLSRDRAKELLVPVAEDYLLAAVQVGINSLATLTVEQRLPLSKRTLANMLNDYVVRAAKDRLYDAAGIRINEDHGFTTFIVDETAAVRIKKMDEDGRYSNYPTQQQIDLLYQRQLPYIGNVTHVVFGYRLDELWRQADQVSFVCWRGKYRCWEIPIADDLQAYLPTIAAEETQVHRTVIRPKRNERKVKRG